MGQARETRWMSQSCAMYALAGVFELLVGLAELLRNAKR